MPSSLALYLHIPFCKQKCNYCAFVSSPESNERIASYFKALLKEIELTSIYYKDRIVDTIYIGGGTPSYVESGYIKTLLEKIKANYVVDLNCEITIECNPDSVTCEKLIEYKNAGVNRLSIGCQTTNNRLLKLLNRPHNKEQFFDSVKLAKEVGFTNINGDLILSLPTQTMKDVKKSVRALTKIGLTHLSVYDLILEENTPFYKKIKIGELKPVSEKLTLKMQNYVVCALSKKGFNRYEVSAYAKKVYESKHNLKYWNLDDYLGLGIAAHSKIGPARFHNSENLSFYIENINKQMLEYEEREMLSLEEQKEEFIMLSLRKTSGIDLEKYKKLFNINLLKHKEKEIAFLKNIKFIKVENGHLFATEMGFNVLNSIIVKLL